MFCMYRHLLSRSLYFERSERCFDESEVRMFEGFTDILCAGWIERMDENRLPFERLLMFHHPFCYSVARLFWSVRFNERMPAKIVVKKDDVETLSLEYVYCLLRGIDMVHNMPDGHFGKRVMPLLIVIEKKVSHGHIIAPANP